jgi:hypothetical protein
MKPNGSHIHECNLCIVGGGYAALNGLNAAGKYLEKGERVVVIDKNATWGGQWVEQYDFVRLHQPYQMFTAGDQKWRLPGRDRSHLATRREILDHLATVPRRSAGHLEIETLFQHAYTGHRVEAGRVEVDATPVGGGPPVRVRAKRLLQGKGVDIEKLPPFPLSSARVRSVGISDPVLTTPEFLEDGAPVYVIGSGKTAMDLVGWLAAKSARQRKVVVVVGSGMYFFVRERAFPTGLARYTSGVPTTDIFLEMVDRFDGGNEVAVMRHLEREGLVHHVFGEAGNCRYGMLSRGERDIVRARVDEAIDGHLVDVDGSKMVVRHRGVERSFEVAPGAWFINCTTHLLTRPHEQVLRDDARVLAPQNVLGFSGTSAYFLTHAWLRGELGGISDRLFRVNFDVEPKLRLTPQFGLALIANFGLLLPRLPFSVAARFQGDFTKWYPLYRQIPVIRRLMASRDAAIAKAERLLPLRYTDPVPAPAPPREVKRTSSAPCR